LKIDQSFVKVMLDDPGGLGIVESVVRLAQAFNRPVIAEGVETPEHGAVLLHFGCRFAQGYGVARPMPVDRVNDWLLDWQGSGAWCSLIAPTADEDLIFKVAARSSNLWLDAIVLQLEQDYTAAQLNAEPENCSFCRWFRSAGFTRYGQYPQYQVAAASHEHSHTLALLAQKAHRDGNHEEGKRLLVALRESKAQQMEDLMQLQQCASQLVSKP
jgi:hypothetical protein